MTKNLVKISPSEILLSDVKALCRQVYFRHSRYQLEHFVVKQKKYPPDIQYKQCLRELDVRYRVAKDLQFELNDIELKVEALEIAKEDYNGHDLSRLEQNQIKQLDNQISQLKFRFECKDRDLAEVMREVQILLDLAAELNQLRKYSSIEEAEISYWQSLDGDISDWEES